MKKVTLLALAITLMSFAAAGAQPGGLLKADDDLGLSDQQIEEIQRLGIQHQKQMIGLQADLKTARLELKELMMKTRVDEKAAISKQDHISAVKADIARAKLQHKLAARKVLNDEQLGKWNKMRMKDGPRGRHHRMSDWGQGPCHMMGPGMGRGPMMGEMMDMPDMPEMPDLPGTPETPESDQD
jgi:septal ring factor EnvC (AmiA/AmiB activator)